MHLLILYAVVLFVVFGLLNSLFEGRAVAKLPFAPVPLVQRMSHRGLLGNNPTDRLLHGLPLLPLLHEHPDQPPEVVWLRAATRGCCGRRGSLPHAHSKSELSFQSGYEAFYLGNILLCRSDCKYHCKIGVIEGSWMIGIIGDIRMPIDGISFQPILVDTKTCVRPPIPS
ncbi:fb27 [Panicum miliaceum]|uniref:Fb27 n=1 Tax=Panicum miliaceum TaxID=4540 RepID=A0A3L6TT73_PANMI|nr:fb27 [Panicum miliaceum]